MFGLKVQWSLEVKLRLPKLRRGSGMASSKCFEYIQQRNLRQDSCDGMIRVVCNDLFSIRIEVVSCSEVFVDIDAV